MHSALQSYYKEIYEEDEMPDMTQEFNANPIFRQDDDNLEARSREYHQNWYKRKAEQEESFQERLRKKREQKNTVPSWNPQQQGQQPVSLPNWNNIYDNNNF